MHQHEIKIHTKNLRVFYKWFFGFISFYLLERGKKRQTTKFRNYIHSKGNLGFGVFFWHVICVTENCYVFFGCIVIGTSLTKKIKWTEFDWSKSVFLSFFILLEKVRLHEHYDKNVFQTSSHLTKQTVAHAMLSHGILCLVAKPSRGTTHSCFEIVQMGMNARASRNVAGFFFALTKRHMTFTKFKQTKKHWM